ncbi:tetratricopeptide repeat protein [Zhihengliuella halotolerans]|uniref:Tetratricopeptide repeat protein n=1 Tax=Zhihengliuella halotolerans TaxID=370736 RepID=A0A4Q8ACE1_9MICC|nr:tetratricopeptide repeat protein [Zhihengliuella halotolerans]RZU61818.1 hypothetical protein EV380_1397 [Zhihengliuella halotolerans]
MAEDRRNSGAERPNQSNRSGGGEGKSYRQGSSPSGASHRGGKRPPFKGAGQRSDQGFRRDDREDRGGRASSGRDQQDRPAKGDWAQGEKKYGEKKFGDKKFGDKKFGPKKFDAKGPRDNRRGLDAQRSGRPDDRRDERDAARVHNPGDLRSSNRPDRPRSPDIDDDVTGKELDRAARAELRYLQEPNGTWVSKHLVMAGRLVDLDPETSYQHALAASRRGGRIAVVREAVGLTAYAAGHFADALREFRTFRRISGSNVHLPMMADCERALGRPEKALEIARSDDAQKLDNPLKVEMAIIASGAQADLGNLEAALAELEIPQLDRNRAYSFSPRLFAVYAEALTDLGRDEEAREWTGRIAVAEKALGVGEFADPEIVDFDDEEDEPVRKPRVKDVLEEPQTVGAPQESVGVDEEDALTVVEPSDASDAEAAEADAAVEADETGFEVEAEQAEPTNGEER